MWLQVISKYADNKWDNVQPAGHYRLNKPRPDHDVRGVWRGVVSP